MLRLIYGAHNKSCLPPCYFTTYRINNLNVPKYTLLRIEQMFDIIYPSIKFKGVDFMVAAANTYEEIAQELINISKAYDINFFILLAIFIGELKNYQEGTLCRLIYAS